MLRTTTSSPTQPAAIAGVPWALAQAHGVIVRHHGAEQFSDPDSKWGVGTTTSGWELDRSPANMARLEAARAAHAAGVASATAAALAGQGRTHCRTAGPVLVEISTSRAVAGVVVRLVAQPNRQGYRAETPVATFAASSGPMLVWLDAGAEYAIDLQIASPRPVRCPTRLTWDDRAERVKAWPALDFRATFRTVGDAR